jgi:hypothetical protein
MISVCALVALLAGGGCCCGPQAAGDCCICLPKPIVWCGEQNECSPGCESCAAPTECGILPNLRRCMTCGKGCGEVYWGEWISDPPDCCDPCDECYGQWTGPHGYCSLGPCQRLLAALHHYKYCPKPCCDEWCGWFCRKGPGHACGADSGEGCSTCGIEQAGHTAVPGKVHYEGPAPSTTPIPDKGILDEDWNRPPPPRPTSNKPIHKAEQPGPNKLGQTPPPVYGRMVKTAAYWGR